MRGKRRRGIGPVGTIVLIWVFFAFILPVLRLSGGLIAAGLAIMASVWAANALRRKAEKTKDEQAAIPVQYTEVTPEPEKPAAQEAPAAEPSPYSPEVQAVIQEGRTALKEMGRLYASIPNPEIRSRINELMSVSDKIIRDAIDDPADVPQIRKFLDFYLPTTIRLLNAYDRMSAQEFGGENITGSMQRIEEMLDTTIAAYKKQLDALFANQAARYPDGHRHHEHHARPRRARRQGVSRYQGFHEAVRTAAERSRGRARSRIRYKLRTNDERKHLPWMKKLTFLP